jgi:pimeloyl-ACP methyl ester carboxylesterase
MARYWTFHAVTFSALAAAATAFGAKADSSQYPHVLVPEGRTKEKCEADPDRIFVKSSAGSECVAYSVTRGFESRREAVFFFGGDFSPEQSHDAAWEQRNLAGNVRYMQSWADRLRVRFVYVSRIGLQGSSGTHGERRFPRETIIMDAAIDALKDRLGVDTVALAGQSGGSTIAASLVTMGRTDVVCDVLGSGALELVDLEFYRASKLGIRVKKSALAAKMYDPASHIGEVARRVDRRIFVLGDPTDKNVLYRFQLPFVDRLMAAGHRAMAIEVEAQGAEHHDVSRFTYPVAGACLNGVADDAIVHAVVRGQTWGEQQHAFYSLGQLPRRFMMPHVHRSASN